MLAFYFCCSDFQSVYNREDDSLLVNWTHCYATTHQKRCLVGDMEPKHRVAKLMESLKTLGK